MKISMDLEAVNRANREHFDQAQAILRIAGQMTQQARQLDGPARAALLANAEALVAAGEGILRAAAALNQNVLVNNAPSAA